MLVTTEQVRQSKPIWDELYFPNRIAYDFRDIYVTGSGNFTSDKGQTGGDQGFASHPAGFVLSHYGIQYGIRNRISDFIWMTFGNRFRGKEKPFLIHVFLLDNFMVLKRSDFH